MNPLLRRIAINGGMVAVVLGIVGMMLAELASMWIIATHPGRPGSAEAKPDLSIVRTRLPLLMAASGFGMVAVGELVLHLLRRIRNPIPENKPSQPDPTEKLLEELLTQAEAKSASSGAAAAPVSLTSEDKPALAENKKMDEVGK